jgi:hypothetical protein
MNVTLVVLCDYALVDQNGKPSIIGMFTDYNAPAFPAVIPPIFLFIEYEAGPGECGQTQMVRVVYLDEDGNQLGAVETPVQVGAVQAPGRRLLINHVVRMDGTVVQKPGVYSFEIGIADETKGTATLHIHGGTN